MENYSISMLKKTRGKIVLLFFTFTALVIFTSCGTSNRTAGPKKILNAENVSIEDSNSVNELARENFISGVINQQKEQHAEAILDFQEALKYDTTASIMYAIAESYLALGRAEQALEYAWKAVNIEPEFIEGYQMIGDIYLAQFEVEKAKEVYEKIVDLAPTLENKYALARLYENDTPDAALKLYKEILKEKEDKNVLSRMSIIYAKKGDMDKFQETLKTLYSTNQGDEVAALFVIESLIGQKLYEEAIDFSDSLDKSLSNEALYSVYGYIGNGLYNDTLSKNSTIERLIKKVDSRFQTDWKLNMLAGMLSDRIGDNEKMASYFQKALSVSDTIPQIPLQIGFYYMQNKMDSAANKVFRDYEKVFPDNAQFPFLIGATYILTKDYKKALTPLQRSYALDKENLETLLNLGHVFDKLNIVDSVHYYYGEALRLFPDNPTINNNYAYFLAERDTLLSKAKEMSLKATELDSKSSSYLDTYAWVLYKLKDYKQALTYVRMAISMGDASAEVFEHLGDILLANGEPQEAKKAYEDAMKKDPERESAKTKFNKIISSR